jgi:hypothetical protein
MVLDQQARRSMLALPCREWACREKAAVAGRREIESRAFARHSVQQNPASAGALLDHPSPAAALVPVQIEVEVEEARLDCDTQINACMD